MKLSIVVPILMSMAITGAVAAERGYYANDVSQTQLGQTKSVSPSSNVDVKALEKQRRVADTPILYDGNGGNARPDVNENKKGDILYDGNGGNARPEKYETKKKTDGTISTDPTRKIVIVGPGGENPSSKTDKPSPKTGKNSPISQKPTDGGFGIVIPGAENIDPGFGITVPGSDNIDPGFYINSNNKGITPK